MSRKTGTLFDFEIDYHRNGVSGTGFHVIKFKEQNGRQSDNMIAVVFPESGSCAVFNLDGLALGNIAFGSNSFRGDVYEPELRKQIEKFNQ